MGINEFRAYALRTMCEEHLWNYGEQDVFALKGWMYRIRREDDGRFSLSYGHVKNEEWPTPMYFPNMARLFHHIFQSRMISYD